MGKLFGKVGIQGNANKERTPESAHYEGRASAFILGQR